ncbi:MAG: site-specific integrase [Clostridia bacterium]|nr:site-specific integrase [Clostridia bacterium]
MAAIVKRKNKYHVVYDYIDDYGVRKQKWKSCNSKREADKFKVEIESKKLIGEFVIPDEKTVESFLEEWVELYSKTHWQHSQYSTVKGMLKNHVYPIIGNISIQDVTPMHIERLYNQLSKKPKYRAKNGECLSSTTIKYIHSTLKVAFKKAEEWLIIDRTPVKCAAPRIAKPKITIWSDDMFKVALKQMDDKLLHLAVHLTFLCSLRPGETLGLTWDCVDFDKGTILINKTIQRAYKDALEELPKDTVIHIFDNVEPDAKTTLILKTPKTKTSVRKVYLSSPLVQELTERKCQVDKLNELLGSDYKDSNLVFCMDDGLPVEVKLCTKWFRDWQKQSMLGYPKLTFHEIRHSSSTYKLRISGGDTKSVQGDTGHAKADTLINTYSHIEDHQRMHLTSTIEEDFYGTPPKQESKKEDDILELIKNNPVLRKKAINVLLSDII